MWEKLNKTQCSCHNLDTLFHSVLTKIWMNKIMVLQKLNKPIYVLCFLSIMLEVTLAHICGALMTFAAMKNLQSQILSLEILPTFATKEETLAFLENNNLEILLTFNSVFWLI